MIRRGLSIWVVLIVVVMAVFTVWVRLTTVRVTYQINYTNQMIKNKTDELGKLKFEVAQLKSPKRLRVLAKRKFNLKPPRSNQIIRMGKVTR